MLQSFSVFISALLVLICSGSCKKSDSKDDTTPAPKGFTVSVSPSIVKLKKGQSTSVTQLSVELKNAPAWEPREVKWTSENPGVVSVEDDGTLHAEATGETNIVAALVSGKGIAKCRVVVTEP